MSYLPGLGKHAPARTLHLVCQVCDDTGWIQAAPVKDSSTGQWVGQFTPIPCFSCFPTRLAVLT
jgi:hypothetical protein